MYMKLIQYKTYTMKRLIFVILAGFLCSICVSSCKKYLDIVPDNIATLDNAFVNRTEAQKYLFTCYSYMPNNGDINDDPAMCAGDEIWRVTSASGYSDIARGFQHVVGPLGDRWGTLFQAINDCNTFLDNIGKVPDMEESEKRRWYSEALFLKAYYNFYLVKMYGPIPLMKSNISVDADEDKTKIYRAPVDSCFHYIVSLLDQAELNLPLTIDNPQQELGRITQPIDRALKAKVLVYAASPLFNGNKDENTLLGQNKEPLFNQTVVKAKWDSAVVACKEAIEVCHAAGISLYHYQPDLLHSNLSDTIITQLSIRNSVCERWNSELIWGNTQYSNGSMQTLMTPEIDPAYADNFRLRGELSPPLKIVEMFYTNHGVPITEDIDWQYNNRYNLQTSNDSSKLHILKDYTSAHLNFEREPRFYADLAFDGSIWYGQGKYDDKQPLFYITQLYNDLNGSFREGLGTVTGYFIKKLIYFQNVISAGNNYSTTAYPFPIIRLSDLFLMYAEAINESEGPVLEAFNYIDSVRVRAGIPTVEDAWTKYSNNPSEYLTQAGFRKIVHNERLIELAFEGQRFWDLRRWKEATTELNKLITSWDLKQVTPAAYYRPLTVFDQKFGAKDYFWPIAESTLERNPNLVQNIGW